MPNNDNTINRQEAAWLVIKGSVVLTLGRFAALVANFFYRIIVARRLGASDFGILSLITVLADIFVSAFGFGLHGSLTRFVAQARARKEDEKPYVSTVFFIVLVAAVVAAAILFFTAGFFARSVFNSPDAVVPFRIGALVVFLLLLKNVFIVTASGFEKFEYNASANIAGDGVKLVATIILLYLGYNLFGAVWGLVIGIVAGTAVNWYWFRKLTRIRLSAVSRRVAKELVRFSMPIYGAAVVGMVRARAAVFLLGYFTTTAEVGIYAVALGLAEVLVQFAGLIQTALFPAYSRAHAVGDIAGLGAMFNRSIKILMYVFIPFVAGGLLIARPLIEVLYGAQYAPGASAFRIIVVSILFLVPWSTTQYFLIATGAVGRNFAVTAGTAAVAIVLAVVLIPRYGIVGGAWALFASRAVAFGWGLWYVKGTIKLTARFLVPASIATAVMCAFVWFLPVGRSTIPGIVALVAGGAVLYFIVLFVVGGFDTSDRRLIRETLLRMKMKLTGRNDAP